MLRSIFSALLVLFLSVLETSFFSSFHGIIRYLPLVFVVSVYLLQHHSLHTPIFWMILHGMILDASRASSIPYYTISYGISAWVALLSAKRFFSNRSFYGVFACASLSALTYELSLGLLLRVQAFMQKTSFSYVLFLQDVWFRFLMMSLCLVVLFSFAKQIRTLLMKFVLIPKSRQTF